MDRELNDARSFRPTRNGSCIPQDFLRAHRGEQRSAYTSRSRSRSRSRAADDKEKCCLESRSWLNLGHPDDGACTFSTILLFLLSALPRVRSPPPRSTEQHLFPLLSLSLPLFPSVCLSCAYSSFGFSPLRPLLFLSLCLSPQRLFSSIDRLLLLFLPLFFPTRVRFKDRVPEDDQMRISEKKRGNARGSRARYRNAPLALSRVSRDGIYKLQERERVSPRAVSIARSFVTSFVKCRDGWAYYRTMFDLAMQRKDLFRRREIMGKKITEKGLIKRRMISSFRPFELRA